MNSRSPDRCFFAGLSTCLVGAQIVLDEQESRHLVGVRRHRVDDHVNVIDGQGALAGARITAISRKTGVTLEIQKLRHEMKPARQVHIACAVPKGDRMQTLLDMATQIGVSSVTPLVFERSQPESRKPKTERWQRVVIESIKQSRRLYLTELGSMSSLQDWLDSPSRTEGLRLLADASGVSPSGIDTEEQNVYVLIGPEGGLSHAEKDQVIGLGFVPLRLSDNILRIETAVVAAASVLSGSSAT